MTNNRISPTTVEIDLKALRRNFRALKGRIPRGVKVLATVKSNAYGHGAVRVARALSGAGADFFGVGTIDEGTQLRRAGIRKPILILLGLIEGYFDELLRSRLTPVLYDLETARSLNRFLEKKGRSMDVHVKVDTGMTRLGILPGEADIFFAQLSRLQSIRPTGLLSHLADADGERVTARQETAFKKTVAAFVSFFPDAKYFHLDNSLAAIDRRHLKGVGREAVEMARLRIAGSGPMEMVRLGIALYGAYPVPRQARVVRLTPVLTWKTRLVAAKTVSRGTRVSYGGTFCTRRPSRIGVIPVGYADGYPRHLSNRSEVLVRGRRAPVLGTVCMDMMMIDLTGHPGARVGDKAVLIGRQGREEIRAEELAAAAGTISYEIFCRISERNRRIYHGR